MFYTDGFIEANDGQGTMLGYDRCWKVMRESRSNDPEVFCKRFLAAHQTEAAKMDDDGTVVAISCSRRPSEVNPS